MKTVETRRKRMKIDEILLLSRRYDSRLQVFAEECYIVVTCRQLSIVIEQKNEFATHVLLNEFATHVLLNEGGREG